MALSAPLEAILCEANVGQEFRTWLAQNGVLTRKDFVLGARSDKAFVDEELICASGISHIVAKIAVRKARGNAEAAEQHDADTTKSAMNLPGYSAITASEASNLQEAFLRRHTFKLPTKHLLADDLQGRLLRDWASSPKRIILLMPEQLRNASSISQPVGSTFFLIQGC